MLVVQIMRQITSAHEVNVLRVSSKTFYPYNVRFNSLYLISRNTEPFLAHKEEIHIYIYNESNH